MQSNTEFYVSCQVSSMQRKPGMLREFQSMQAQAAHFYVTVSCLQMF